MPVKLALQLLALTFAYGLAFIALAKLLRKGGISPRWIFLAAGAVFGALSGLLVVWIWPLDSARLVNFYAILLGDAVYNAAISWIGEPAPNQAHSTIPWLLRVPQVYLVASLTLSVLIGGLVQWPVNRRRHLG